MATSDFHVRSFSGLAKRGRFKVSLFPAATILVLVVFDGLIAKISRLLSYSRIIMRTPLLAAILSMIADMI